jgi:hypothetical protein
MLSTVRNSLSAVAIAAVAFTIAQPASAAFPTAVSSPIADSITQANTKVLGDAPSIAMGNLFRATSQALANAALNATSNLQQANIIPQAATTQGVSTLYSIDTAATGIGLKSILSAPFATGASALLAQNVGTATIPPEGFVAGSALLAFDNDGLPGSEPDFWVVADEGFDYYLDRNGNVILLPANVRTFGNATSPAAAVAIAIPLTSVDQFFPNVFNSPSISTSLRVAAGFASASGDVLPPFQYFFGIRDAAGDISVFGSYLAEVPEPTSLALLASLLIITTARRRPPSA